MADQEPKSKFKVELDPSLFDANGGAEPEGKVGFYGARSWCRSPGPEHTRGSRDLPKEVGGHLNPRFVEWLMGFPVGWVDRECN
jgi:hypothetical protein